jgi:hypothetical protein
LVEQQPKRPARYLRESGRWVQVEPETEELGVEGDGRVDVGDDVTNACVIHGLPLMNAIRPALPVASRQRMVNIITF